jgi:hypothetical protein
LKDGAGLSPPRGLPANDLPELAYSSQAPIAGYLGIPTVTSMTSNPQKFPARVFLGAGVYGIIVLLPQYFLEAKLGRDYPPPLTHPENFYGFIGVALAWQFVFLLIARDPQRYRLLMLPAILEKLSFGLAVLVLFSQGRVASIVVAAGCIDLLLAVLFTLSFRASATRAS